MDLIPILTREMLARSRMIGEDRGIRDVQRLIGSYGGTVRGWIKKSTQPLVVNGRPAEVYWYEHQGVGRVEEKIKWLDSHESTLCTRLP